VEVHATALQNFAKLWPPRLILVSGQKNVFVGSKLDTL
jgi:hypothetical protein